MARLAREISENGLTTQGDGSIVLTTLALYDKVWLR